MIKSMLQIAVISTLLAAPLAQAEGYLGASIGLARMSVDCEGTNTCDNTHTGAKVFGGYRAPNGWGGEVLYVDWGRARATATIVELGEIEGEIKAQGFGAALAYHAPFANDWIGVFRLGALSNRAKGKGVLGELSGTVSERHTSVYYGVGLGYRVMKNLSIDAAVDASRIKLLGETANTTLVSVGVTAAF